MNTIRMRNCRLLRFAFSSLCVLSVKIGLLWILGRYTSPRIAYGLTHIFIFLLSYLLHSVYTFRMNLDSRGLLSFFKAVFIIKLLDYTLFAVFITFVPDSVLLAVVVTLVTFIARYFILHASFDKQRKPETPVSRSSSNHL